MEIKEKLGVDMWKRIPRPVIPNIVATSHMCLLLISTWNVANPKWDVLEA